MFRIYQEELPTGAKEERTIEGERMLFNHLLRHLKPKTAIVSVSAGTAQEYVEQRSKDRFRNRYIGPETVKKKITTLRLVRS